jgi:hypothetical protein
MAISKLLSTATNWAETLSSKELVTKTESAFFTMCKLVIKYPLLFIAKPVPSMLAGAYFFKRFVLALLIPPMIAS